VNATTDNRSPTWADGQPQQEPMAAVTPPRPFFPDLFVYEAAVALAMLIALIVVAALTKAPLEETASRDAAGFTPRPEWYFLWLFQLLKYFKGSFEAVGTVLVPTLLVVLLLAVPFVDRRPAKTKRLFGRTRPLRVAPRVIALVAVALLLALTIVAAISAERGATTAPPPTIPEWPPQSRLNDPDGRAATQSTVFDLLTRRSDV
jgi:quinol-cytochrome oxidoreductase complex cytochrome b subunit